MEDGGSIYGGWGLQMRREWQANEKIGASKWRKRKSNEEGGASKNEGKGGDGKGQKIGKGN